MTDFFEFTLIAMEKVDPRVMKRPEGRFPQTRCSLDCAGVLDKDDLIALARRMLKSLQSRLEHAANRKNLDIYSRNMLESV
jgi:hypothetical protein